MARPVPSRTVRDTIELASMLTADLARIDPHRFGPGQLRLLRLAASDPRVERIFVSPVIKLALCRDWGGATRDSRAWLHRLSPWWGHDDHFHVRLRCPADSPLCEPQPPVPPDDGCDASLAKWAAHPLPPVAQGPTAPPKPKLPAACTALLAEP
jgi:penicillin-insensitive murein endopeptidase